MIVTADHAHASQIIGNEVKGAGADPAVKTTDGAVILDQLRQFGRPDDQEHTGAQLRIAAYGPGAANVTGLTDQTDLFFTIAGALGLQAATE